MIARSGIDISYDVFDKFLKLILGSEPSLSQCHRFIQALMLAVWVKSLGRQNIQTLVGRLHTVIGTQIISSLKGTDMAAKDLS